MTDSRPRIVLWLGSQWLRTRSTRRSAVVLAVAFGIVAIVYVSVSAFTLSASQVADAALGVEQQRTYTSVASGDLQGGDLRLARAAVRSAVPGSELVLESFTVRPDSFAKTYVQAPLDVLRFVEVSDLRHVSPRRYTLEDGSWPVRPFDVVVSRHVWEALPDRTSITALSGRATFRVVGVVRDAYAERSDLIVAGPGTWEAIPNPKPGHQAQPVEAHLSVYFGGDGRVSQIEHALRSTLPATATGPDFGSILIDNHATRAQIIAEPVPRFGTDHQIVSYLPLLLIVLLVSALVASQQRAAHQRSARQLAALGVRRATVLASQALALVLVAAGSILVGSGVGWLIALGLRATVLPVVSEQPLSPPPGPDRIEIAIAGLSLLLIAAGVLWPTRIPPSTTGSTKSRFLGDVDLGWIRRVSIVLLAVAAVRLGGSGRSAVAPYLAVAAVLLIAPDAFRWALRLLPERRVRPFVVARLIRADLGRVSTAVVVVGCCVALPICASSQLGSKKASDASYSYSRIPAGQVWVTAENGIGDVAGVARAVADTPDIAQPVAVRRLQTSGRRNLTATFTKRGPGNSNLGIMVLDSTAKARRLFGAKLSPHAEKVLRSGGVLDLTRAQGQQQFVIANDAKTLFVTPDLLTLKVHLGRQYQAQGGGVVLRRTAEHLNLPISSPESYVFPHASKTVITNAVQAAVNSGYDSEFVQYSVAPPPPRLPLDDYVFLAGLILSGFAVMVLVLRTQATRLRAYSARLIAIGLTPRWTASVLATQAAMIVGVALLSGIAAGIVGVKVSTSVYPVVVTPTLPIVLACTATLIAAVSATALAMRTLTIAEQPEMT